MIMAVKSGGQDSVSIAFITPPNIRLGFISRKKSNNCLLVWVNKRYKMSLIFIAFITGTLRRAQGFIDIESLVRHEEQVWTVSML